MFSSFNHKMRLLAIATIAFSLPGFSAFANDDITFEVPPTDPPENVGNNHGHWRMPPHPISACYSDGVLSSAEWPYVDEALHIDIMDAGGTTAAGYDCAGIDMLTGITIGYYDSFVIVITTESGIILTGTH